MASFHSILLVSLTASLLACSSSDDGGTSSDSDTGVTVDSSTNDSHVADSGHDARSDSAGDADAAHETATDAGSETATDSGADADGTSADSIVVDSIVDDVADGPKACDAVVGDCPSGQYCDAVGCGLGTCKPAPFAPPSLDLAPVCGCDGVTYWNAEQAQSQGKSYTSGACDITSAGTRHCGGSIGGACPGTDTCIADHSSTGTCPAPTVGSTCWFIPATPPCATDPKTYRDCGDSACHSYCEVLLSGDAFYSDGTCP